MMRSFFCCAALALSAPVAAVGQEDAGSSERIIETYGYEAREKATGIERGRQVYEQWCIICHDTGPGMAGTEALMRKYKGAIPALLTERGGLTTAYIELFVRNGVKSMPTFRKTEVSDDDLEWLGQYLAQPVAAEE